MHAVQSHGGVRRLRNKSDRRQSDKLRTGAGSKQAFNSFNWTYWTEPPNWRLASGEQHTIIAISSAFPVLTIINCLSWPNFGNAPTLNSEVTSRIQTKNKKKIDYKRFLWLLCTISFIFYFVFAKTNNTMSESEQSNKVNEFAGITNVDPERAKFYLESAAWRMDAALASFYDEGADDEPPNENAGQSSSRPSVASNRDVPMASKSSYKPLAKPKKWQPQSRIMTFSSLKNAEVEDKDSDEDEGQRFYAGGSITSGQQVIGPPRNNADVITDMFQTAQKYASTSAPSGSSSSTHDSGPSNFFGTGYKLGQTENDTEVIPSHNATTKRSSNQEEVVLKVWKEGFTINDGELHSIDRPENREFLLMVARGEEIPPLLLKEANVSSEDELHVSVEDHRYEEYIPSKPKKKIFGGSGNLLGSPAPDVVGNEVSKEITSDSGVANEAVARAEVPLIPDAPTTSLQIRLVDGTRIVATFNHSHTIGDIRRYIVAARSSFGSRPFKLQSSYPPKTLDNDDQTLSEAGLLNAVIFQRFG